MTTYTWEYGSADAGLHFTITFDNSDNIFTVKSLIGSFDLNSLWFSDGSALSDGYTVAKFDNSRNMNGGVTVLDEGTSTTQTVVWNDHAGPGLVAGTDKIGLIGAGETQTFSLSDLGLTSFDPTLDDRLGVRATSVNGTSAIKLVDSTPEVGPSPNIAPIADYTQTGSTLSITATGLAPINGAFFPDGVSSGDVTQTSAVLWTRAVDLGKLTFQIATDNSFQHVVRSAKVTVTDSSIPVKAEFDHLNPSQEYFYRAIDANGHVIQGSFGTAAALGAHTGFDFGVGGDFAGELAPYPALKNVAAANLDLFIKDGDTIYADLGIQNGQFVPTPTNTLEEFLAKDSVVHDSHFGFNYLADLQATTPILAAIDDHEVIDNFAGGAPPSSDPRFASQPGDFINQTPLYANGLKAFSAYNAIEDHTYTGTDEARFDGAPDLYRYNTHGSDAAIIMVDQRTFRDAEISPNTLNPDPIPFITASLDPSRTMLGDVQLNRLEHDLLDARDNGITWKFVVLQEPIQQSGPIIFPGDRYEGYAAERNALLKFIDDNHIENVVFISSDSHWFSVNNLTYQAQPGGPQIQSSAIDVTTMAVGAPPLAPEIAQFLHDTHVLSDDAYNFYLSLPNAPDPGLGGPLDKDDFIQGILDNAMIAAGVDPIGLSPAQATLLQGDYFVGHDFGWTDFKIDPTTAQLLTTTYGIPFYTDADLATNPNQVLGLEPSIVSQFEMTPTSHNLLGTSGDDDLQGTGGDDVLLGAAGNDVLHGRDGNDYVDGGNGNDQLFGGLGNDQLFGRDGNDILNGDEGNDQIRGGAGNDSAFGGPGDDTFISEKGDGNDLYDGGGGSDTLDLSATSAPAEVNLAKGSATSSDIGHDQLVSIENVIGGTGNDTIIASSVGCRLAGGAGNDTLKGGPGNDTLIGGLGADTLRGDAGKDVFVYNSPSEGGDTIQAFNVTDDTLAFSASGFGGGLMSGQLLVNGLTFIDGTAPTASTTAGTFLYDTGTHDLLWDADGSGTGNAVQIVHFDAAVALKADDLTILA